MEAMEIMELYCDTLLARFSLLEQLKCEIEITAFHPSLTKL